MRNIKRDQIDQCTKDALRRAKGNGIVLGKTGIDRARENIAEAEVFARRVAGEIEAVQEEGLTTLPGIAYALNERGIPAMCGGIWYPKSVLRVLERLVRIEKRTDTPLV